MDDLSLALGDHGIKNKRPEYCVWRLAFVAGPVADRDPLAQTFELHSVPSLTTYHEPSRRPCAPICTKHHYGHHVVQRARHPTWSRAKALQAAPSPVLLAPFQTIHGAGNPDPPRPPGPGPIIANSSGAFPSPLRALPDLSAMRVWICARSAVQLASAAYRSAEGGVLSVGGEGGERRGVSTHERREE